MICYIVGLCSKGQEENMIIPFSTNFSLVLFQFDACHMILTLRHLQTGGVQVEKWDLSRMVGYHEMQIQACYRSMSSFACHIRTNRSISPGEDSTYYMTSMRWD